MNPLSSRLGLLVAMLVLTGCLPRDQSSSGSSPSATPSASGPRIDADEPARFASVGMPALADLWMAKEMQAAARATALLASRDPRHLPSADTEQGTAFFRALRRSTAEYYRLSSSDKVDFSNQFITLAPLYAKAARQGTRCDKELALLIGLELEQAVQFIQDRAFVAKAPGTDASGTTPGWNPRGGNVLVYFASSQARIGNDLRANLRMLGEEPFFRPEARALALSYAARHLPPLCRALQLEGVRPILAENARKETDPATLASYQALLANAHVR